MSKNLFAARAATLGGKVRDITRTRDGFLVAAVITGNDSAATVAKIAGVDPANVSRLVKMARTYPAIEALIAAVEPGAKGDTAALALGTALAEQKKANADAQAALNSTSRNAGGTTPAAATGDAPSADTLAPKGESTTTSTRSGIVTTTAPITPADIMRSLAAMRDAVAGLTFTAEEAGLLEEALAEVWSSVTVA